MIPDLTGELKKHLGVTLISLPRSDSTGMAIAVNAKEAKA